MIVKLMRRSINEYYHYDECDSLVEKFTEQTEWYHYNDEKEKLEHSRSMQELGYRDSGQRKENIGTIMSPTMVWFGSYYKYEIAEQNE